MSFYETISKYYDAIFPVSDDALDFIRRAAGEPVKRIFDVACGTGGYSIALAREGYHVTAADIDEKMVQIAREKVERENHALDVLQWDMRHIGKLSRKFDCVFCIGNSIVHLGSRDEILDVLKQIYNLLENKGTIVLQIINYDRILKKGISGLPTIKNETAGVEFIRKYRYDQEKRLIFFDARLVVGTGENQKIYDSSVALFPLMSEELLTMLKEAGFCDISFYGGFDGLPYDQDSYLLVAKAAKKDR